MRRWLLGIAGLIVVLFIALMLLPTSPRTPGAIPTPTSVSPRPTTPLPPTNTPIPGRPAVGQEGTLWTGNTLTWWPLAVDGAVDEYVTAGTAADATRLGQMLKDGRVFTVDQDTRLLVLDQKWPTVKVRILEGPQTGREGWLPYEHVRFAATRQ